MEQYKQNFISFLAKSSALQFGEFTLKSGRLSPYFINTGLFNTGEQIATLGKYYAQAINQEFEDKFDLIYGPAYKGIPLCVAAAYALSQEYGLNKKYTFNRKEVKDHGDKKMLVGHEPQPGEKVLIIDDVITDGGALLESLDVLKHIDLKYAGVILSVNRQEKTKDDKNAVADFEKNHSIPIRFIVTISEIVEFLHNRDIDGQTYLDDAIKNNIEEYLNTYGV